MEIDLRQTVHQSGAYKKGLGPSSPTLRKDRKEMFYLTMHSTYFIYGYMAPHIW